MSPNSVSVCPQCGASTSDVTNDLCPRCLMAQIIEPTQHGAGAASAAPPLSPEELAPHFPQLEILECLGRGGMGVVYKARQKSLNRLVALKLLAPERADDPQFAARFKKEAHALAALNNPNIVSVYDFGVTQTLLSEHPAYFLLMEFVDGVNLRQLMQAKKLTSKEALSIVPPVCDALQCAHDHGIVHRDIKPENLLIDKNGTVKIADFGIAKMYGSHLAPRDEHGAGASTDDSRSPEAHGSDGRASPISRSEMATLGTPDYAAPEQANGTADHRADIYSLGVVLYEMLTGERPKENIIPPSKRVQVDIRIDEIVLRALEKQPELRFATAAEFRTQVELAAEDEADTIRLAKNSSSPVGQGGHWHSVLQLCGILGLVVLGGNLVIASGLWILTGQPWPLFRPQELPWIIVLMAACLVSVSAASKLRTKPLPSSPSPIPAPASPDFKTMIATVATLFYAIAGLCVVLRMLRIGVAVPLIVSAVVGAALWRCGPLPRAARAGVWRGLSWLSISLTLPVIAMGCFAITQILAEQRGWHPAPMEAVFTSLAWLGMILLPWAGVVLRHASRPARKQAIGTRRVGCTAALVLLLVFGALVFAVQIASYVWTRSREAALHEHSAALKAQTQAAFTEAIAHQLQGEWRGSESGREGECSLTVEGRNVHFQGVDELEWYRAAFEMVPDTNPQQFRSTITECPFPEYVGKVSLAIIAIDGDRLSFVGNEPGVPIAPPGFEGDGHSRHFVFRKVVDVAAASQWIVEGRVVDDKGKPVADATIHVSTGMGSLHETGAGKTDADGRYRVTFGPGIMVATKDRAGALQAAIVQVSKDGFEEKDLCHAGDLLMAWELTKQQLAGGWQPGPERTFLPDKPLTVDFVLVPAAQIEGTLIDKNGQPVADREIIITGDRLRPVSSIYATAHIDANGRFTFKDVSTLHAWSFSIDGTPGHPDRTPPDRLVTPGVHAVTLVATGHTLSLPLPPLPPSDARAAHALQMRWVAEAASDQTEEMQVRGTGAGDRPIEKLPIEKEVLIDARQVKLVGVTASEASDQQGARRIGLTLTDEGAARFAMLTRQGKGRRLALILGGQLWTAPVIRAEITGGVIEISGSFSETEAAALADEIRSCVTTYKETTTIQGTMKDDDLKQLDCRAFDETPGKYWRELSEVRRFRDAAKLIERYLELHPDLEPRDTASLHFHAAQCWALIVGDDDDQQRQECLKSAIQHLKTITAAPRLAEDGKLLPIEYVSGTMGFLLRDRAMLLSAYEKLARGDAINKSYLGVLDRLLAHFGKSYAEAYETGGQDHKKLSADSFNRAWELIDKTNRTEEDDDRMISLAHESLAHWRMREDCTDQNLSIGYWQISRVYAVLHQGESAKRFGGLCLSVSGKEPPFYLGYAHEALARAALLTKDRPEFGGHLAAAKALAAKVADSGERKMLEDDLAGLVFP